MEDTFDPTKYYYYRERPFDELLGKTLTKVEVKRALHSGQDDEIVFHCDDGKVYRQVYHPDCCASCSIEEIHGELADLENTPILMAEEATSQENPEGVTPPDYQDSFTWTFYKLATIKGSVTIRWYGESNGYYSEQATFERVK